MSHVDAKGRKRLRNAPRMERGSAGNAISETWTSVAVGTYGRPRA